MAESSLMTKECVEPVFSEKSRFLSITFDDGFLYGSQVACDILARHGLAATFYLVTGWVEPERTTIREVCNAGRRHGDWDYWRGVNSLGHEIGSHTFSHIHACGRRARWLPWLLPREMKRSRDDLVREVPQDIYTIAMPFVEASRRSERLARSFYAACRLGAPEPVYNRLDALTPYRLDSWEPASAAREDNFRNAIAGIPAGGWLILGFHSFDDEGWEPVSRGAFDALCRFAAKETDVVVAPVSTIIAHKDRCERDPRDAARAGDRAAAEIEAK
jgi:peptidoglycan/xylan/chitin deacetylase (PgdA/CDA1 family)